MSLPTPKPIVDTLPTDEQLVRDSSNPYSFAQSREQYEAWNAIYSWGWVRHKFYVANKLRVALDEILFSNKLTEEEKRAVFEELFNDVP